MQLSRDYVNVLLVFVWISFVSGCFETYAQSEQLALIEKLEVISDIKLDPLKLNQTINFDSMYFSSGVMAAKTDRRSPDPSLVTQSSAPSWKLKGTFIMSKLQIAWLDLGPNKIYELSVGDKLPGQSWVVSRIFSDRVELSYLTDSTVSPEYDERLQLWMSSRLY